MTAKDVMTIAEVAEFLGYSNINGVRTWVRRRGIKPLYRKPGRGGVSVFARKDIEEGKRSG